MKLVSDWKARMADSAPSRFAMLGFCTAMFLFGGLLLLREENKFGYLLVSCCLIFVAVGWWVARSDGIDYYDLEDAPSSYDSIQKVGKSVGYIIRNEESGELEVQLDDSLRLSEVEFMTTIYVARTHNGLRS
jgi:hypothetical protein